MSGKICAVILKKVVNKFEAKAIVSLVLIGQFYCRKFDDFIPEIECCHYPIHDTTARLH